MIQLLLLPSDEQLIAERIVLAYPSVVFIDDIFWEAPDKPPVRSRISECARWHVQIWNRELFPELPTGTRDEGRIIEGPTVGPVIQWVRSQLKDGLLTTGWLGVSGFKEERQEITRFFNTVLRTARSACSNALVRAGWIPQPVMREDRERQHWVGPAAMQQARDGQLMLVDALMRMVPE